MEVIFYNVKTRTKVGVPTSNIKKTMMQKTTKNGSLQTRYVLKAEFDGAKLTKFVSQSDWEALDAPVVEPAKK